MLAFGKIHFYSHARSSQNQSRDLTQQELSEKQARISSLCEQYLKQRKQPRPEPHKIKSNNKSE